MIMNRIRIIGILILTLAVIAPDAALADWKVYYTGKAAGMFGAGGRGNFATRSQCEAYRSSSAGFERNNSYCSGFDLPSYTPPAQSSSSGDDGTAAREQEKQRQLQLQREQKERELELARQKKFAEEKDQLLGTFKGHSTGTLGLKGTGTSTPGLEKPTGKGRRDSAIVDPTVVDMQKLTKYREELYKLQMDQQKITESLGDITREFSVIGTETQKIIDANEDKLLKTATDATTEVIASRRKNMEVFKNVYDTIDAVNSYPKIKDMDELVKQLKGTISYIGKVSKLFGKIDWAIQAAEPWLDVWKEHKYIERLPELEIQCRALVLDTGSNRIRQQELMQEIKVLRQRIHGISGIPLSQIPATPLRPAGLGSYVPRLYPTEESLTKARQKG
jgi:hypothetical protein